METKNSFKVEREDGMVVLTNVGVKVMKPNEAVLDLENVRGDLLKARKAENDFLRAIKEEHLSKELEKVKEKVNVLEKLEKEWEGVIEGDVRLLRDDIVKKVKVEKAKKGYSRVSDVNAKIVLMNSILAPVVLEVGLDMNHPIVRKIKEGFDEL
jgi:hypothetical protein